MTALRDALVLLWGTVVHRPYVYAFFLCFLAFSLFQQGPRRTTLYLLVAYLIALASELASTRVGFPFGMYVYVDTMRAQELWISNVPFWDSLSFVFLSYFSWMLAGALRGSLRSPWTYALSGLLMMLLDVVIDPVTLLGDRWFLGKIYYYPQGGTYFGVTLANFAGWWLVGAVTPWLFQSFFDKPTEKVAPLSTWGVYGVYAGVFAFNLAVTAYVQEWRLLVASTAVASATLGACAISLLRKKPLRA